MALWDRVQSMLALAPWQEPEVQTRSREEFPDLQTQLAALQREPRPWRPASITEAMGVPAIFRAVSLIANTVGSLSLEAFQNGSLITDQTSVPRIIIRPNPFSTPRNFFRDTAYYLATRGEAWWWVAARDTDNTPLSLWPVPPWEVVVAQNDRNRLRPTITWQDKQMPNEDMRHITFLPDSANLRGVGPLQFCGAAASVTVESQEWAANFYAGNLPSAIGTTDQDIDETDAKELDAQWLEKDKSNLPRWMGKGMHIEPFAFNPEQAQLGEAREFQVGETARMFGIPGPLLEFSAPGSSLTYQNNESVWREFQEGCLSPNYLEPIEQEMSDLLTRSTVSRFNVNQLLRADSKTRWEIYQIMAAVVGPEQASVIARQFEGLAPGNVDFAPVPATPPSAIPGILPPDVQARSAIEQVNVRCQACGKLLAERLTIPYRLACPRCKAQVAA